MDAVGQPQPAACQGRHQPIVVGHEPADLARPVAGFPAAIALGEGSRVHGHGTDRGAQAVGGAGGRAVVGVGVVEVIELAQIAGVLGQGHVALERYALARRGGEVARGAHRFAVAALDAAVDDGIDGRHGFQVLEVHFLVVV